ncbi:MAG: hypothetical protein KDB96_11400 [Flavobacteriales bacterium]|nr:hypothetical protein [Flavobacteriales bacterium]MCB0809874.1 hypothetical protein [Flavobacteriales bacterium]MCB0814793.1 hypothetical protein [Flavobacteriales bacterium]
MSVLKPLQAFFTGKWFTTVLAGTAATLLASGLSFIGEQAFGGSNPTETVQESAAPAEDPLQNLDGSGIWEPATTTSRQRGNAVSDSLKEDLDEGSLAEVVPEYPLTWNQYPGLHAFPDSMDAREVRLLPHYLDKSKYPWPDRLMGWIMLFGLLIVGPFILGMAALTDEADGCLGCMLVVLLYPVVGPAISCFGNRILAEWLDLAPAWYAAAKWEGLFNMIVKAL